MRLDAHSRFLPSSGESALAVDHFAYRDGRLFGEDVDLVALALEHGTPLFVYSAATLRDHFTRLQDAFSSIDPLICYAVKANANLSVLRLLGELGAGMDVVSAGELHRAIESGVDASKCVYAGVGKTEDDIEVALRAGISSINAESEQELDAIATIAARLGVVAPVCVRVNPDVDAKTHRHTTTGIRETKFGIDRGKVPALFEAHRGTDSIDLCGLHVHLGSPIAETGPFVEGIGRLLELADQLEASGASIRRLDIGGGFAADYETGHSPSAAVYAEAIVPLLEARVRSGLKVVLEPGRSIAANAGVLLLRVVVRKRSGERDFLVLDGGMNVLLRPSHYDAFHFAWPAQTNTPPPSRCERPDVDGLEIVDLVGPICETGDFIARDRPFPKCDRGDLVAVFAAGAYGMTMASHYNAMPLPAEVMVEGDEARVIRRRETIEDLIALER